jgi:SAM-dependent methyltransferase
LPLKISEMANAAGILATTDGFERERLLKAAAARLSPRLSDPNFLVLRARRLIFQNWISQMQGAELSVLDVGGRYQPYRPLFNHRARRYFACDIRRTSLVNVVGSGESLPFAPNSFDVVIATQVFDYFAQPYEAAEQMRTVLKPGGCLLMSVASVAPRFSDEEYWRFTPAGIRAILAGFSQISVIPEVSSVGGIIRNLNLAIHSFAVFKSLRAIAECSVIPVFNLLGLLMERLQITRSDQFTPNYSAIAVK